MKEIKKEENLKANISDSGLVHKAKEGLNPRNLLFKHNNWKFF